MIQQNGTRDFWEDILQLLEDLCIKLTVLHKKNTIEPVKHALKLKCTSITQLDNDPKHTSMFEYFSWRDLYPKNVETCDIRSV